MALLKVAEASVVEMNDQEVGRPPVSTDPVEQIRIELDAYYDEMKRFSTMDLGSVFQRLAAFSARASEVRGLLTRSDRRTFASCITKELDPFIAECDRQFRLWSRFQAIRQMDFDLSKGY